MRSSLAPFHSFRVPPLRTLWFWPNCGPHLFSDPSFGPSQLFFWHVRVIGIVYVTLVQHMKPWFLASFSVQKRQFWRDILFRKYMAVISYHENISLPLILPLGWEGSPWLRIWWVKPHLVWHGANRSRQLIGHLELLMFVPLTWHWQSFVWEEAQISHSSVKTCSLSSRHGTRKSPVKNFVSVRWMFQK
jgi:hypothetical protein